jgi:hypothetical protein
VISCRHVVVASHSQDHVPISAAKRKVFSTRMFFAIS